MNRPHDSRGFTTLEKLTLAHVAVLMLASTWLYGGNIGWARTALSVWGSLGTCITLAGFVQRRSSVVASRRRLLAWLLPPAAYALLVIVSCFNVSFTEVTSDGARFILYRGEPVFFLPGTVDAGLSLHSLWFGAGVYLSAFNLCLVAGSRRLLRTVFVLLAGNTLLLSIFGTLQSLSSAGYYFGASESPNPRFFSTFIYNNHWGAFMILALSVSFGLLYHLARKHTGRDLWHSPFSGAVVCMLLIAATAPVSASRAATGMAATLLAIALVHACVKLAASRRREGRSMLPSLSILLLVVAVTSCAIGWLGQRAMQSRYTETRLALQSGGNILEDRFRLYADTWQLAVQKPAYGWGLDSYATAFQLIRPRPVQTDRQYERGYATAHNDWLQSLAETGFVGTGLLVLALALPLASLARSSLAHPLVAYPLLGLAITLLYAGFEFPFASAAFLSAFLLSLFTAVGYARLGSRSETTLATRP